MEQEKNEVKEVEIIEENKENQKPQKCCIIYGIIALAVLTVIIQIILIVSGNKNIFNAVSGLGLSIFCVCSFSGNAAISTVGLRAGVINKHKPTIVMSAISLGISVFADIISVSALFSCIDSMIGA